MTRGLAAATALLLLSSGASAADDDSDAAVRAAARDLGCDAVGLRALTMPHAGIYEVRCTSGAIIWLRRHDDGWRIVPIG